MNFLDTYLRRRQLEKRGEIHPEKRVTPNLQAYEAAVQAAYERTLDCVCQHPPPRGAERTAWLKKHGKLCKKRIKLGWRRAWQCQHCLRNMDGDGVNAGPVTELLPEYVPDDSPLRKAADNARLRAWRELKPSRRAAWFADHDLYLKSDVWKKLRADVLKRDRYRCVDCGAKAQHVHHLTYDRWQEELLSDLVALCFPCHDRRHEDEP